LNGKVERSHRIDQEEFYRQLKGVVMHGTEEYNQRLDEWERFYNYFYSRDFALALKPPI
jgi:hypothetical protein